MKNKPQIRTCIITGEKLNQNDLMQICVNPIGEVIVNESGKAGEKGRCVYIKRDKKAIEQFLKRPVNFLSNFIKREIGKEKFEEIKEKLIQFNNEKCFSCS